MKLHACCWIQINIVQPRLLKITWFIAWEQPGLGIFTPTPKYQTHISLIQGNPSLTQLLWTLSSLNQDSRICPHWLLTVLAMLQMYFARKMTFKLKFWHKCKGIGTSTRSRETKQNKQEMVYQILFQKGLDLCVSWFLTQEKIIIQWW